MAKALDVLRSGSSLRTKVLGGGIMGKTPPLRVCYPQTIKIKAGSVSLW